MVMEEDEDNRTREELEEEILEQNPQYRYKPDTAKQLRMAMTSLRAATKIALRKKTPQQLRQLNRMAKRLMASQNRGDEDGAKPEQSESPQTPPNADCA